MHGHNDHSLKVSLLLKHRKMSDIFHSRFLLFSQVAEKYYGIGFFLKTNLQITKYNIDEASILEDNNLTELTKQIESILQR